MTAAEVNEEKPPPLQCGICGQLIDEMADYITIVRQELRRDSDGLYWIQDDEDLLSYHKDCQAQAWLSLSLVPQLKWAKSHRLHAGGPWPKITVTLHYAPQVSRVRDSDNLVATEKPLVDGLVDAGVVRDDDTSQVIRNPAVIHPATGQKGRLWLTVQIHDEPQSEVAS